MTELAPRRPAALGSLEMAERSLAEAKTLPDMAPLVAGAEVMRVYHRKARLSLDAQNDWAWFKIRAQRKAGEILAELERSQGGRPSETGPETGQVSPWREAIDDIDLPRQRAHEWQRLAAIPDELLDDYRAERRSEQFQELTVEQRVADALPFVEGPVAELTARQYFERPCQPCRLDQHDHCLHPTDDDPQDCCCDALERSP